MYCRFCGSKRDEDAVFCPGCGRRREARHKKGKRMILFLLVFIAILCLSIHGVSRYHKTENYIVNIKYKKIAEKFKDRFEVLDSAEDVKYMVAEFDGASYIRATGKRDGEEYTLAGIREKGKWKSTDTQSEDIVVGQMNEDLAYMVEENMLAKADRIAIYDEEFQVFDVLERNEY